LTSSPNTHHKKKRKTKRKPKSQQKPKQKKNHKKKKHKKEKKKKTSRASYLKGVPVKTGCGGVGKTSFERSGIDFAYEKY